MRPNALVLPVLAPVLLTLACAEPTVLDPAQPSFSVGTGPAAPGSSGVVRFGDQLIIRLDYVTEQGERLVRHYPADDSFEVCGGSQSLPAVAEQFVTDPNFINGVVVVLNQSREIPVFIYPPADGSKPLCDYLRDDWLFRGTGSLVYNDSNFFFDPSRTDAFGWKGEGTVYDRSGNRYRYTENQLIVVDPESFTEHVVRAKLELIPVH